MYKAALAEDSLICRVGFKNREDFEKLQDSRKNVFGYVKYCRFKTPEEQAKLLQLARHYGIGDVLIENLERLFVRQDIERQREELENTGSTAQLDHLMAALDEFMLYEKGKEKERMDDIKRGRDREDRDYFFGSPNDFACDQLLKILLAVRNTGQKVPELLERQFGVEQKLIDFMLNNLGYSVASLERAIDTARSYAATPAVTDALKVARDRKLKELYQSIDDAVARFEQSGKVEDHDFARKTIETLNHTNRSNTKALPERFKSKTQAAFKLGILAENRGLKDSNHTTQLIDALLYDCGRFPEARAVALSLAREMMGGTKLLAKIESAIAYGELSQMLRDYDKDGKGNPEEMAKLIDDVAPVPGIDDESRDKKETDRLNLCCLLIKGMEKHVEPDSPVRQKYEQQMIKEIRDYSCQPRYDFIFFNGVLWSLEGTVFRKHVLELMASIQKAVFDDVQPHTEAYKNTGAVDPVYKSLSDVSDMPFWKEINPPDSLGEFRFRKVESLINLLIAVEKKNQAMQPAPSIAQQLLFKNLFNRTIMWINWEGTVLRNVKELISKSDLSEGTKHELLLRMSE